MSNIALNLIVLRSPDLARAAEFYSRLGLHFTRHQHGSGLGHFAAELGSSLFELYPLSPAGPSTLGTCIGFSVPSLDSAIAALGEYPGPSFHLPRIPSGDTAQSSQTQTGIVSNFFSNDRMPNPKQNR